MFLSCLLGFHLASGSQNLHTSQAYTYGDDANTDYDVSLLGRSSSGLKQNSDSLLLHDNGAGYGNAFGFSGSEDDAKLLHASLPDLDVTKNSVDDATSFRSSHGYELLSGVRSEGNGHEILDSLQHSSFGNVHNAYGLSDDSGDHIKKFLLSSASGASGIIKGSQSLHSVLDTHATLTEDTSSVHSADSSHTAESHSYLNSIMKAFSHGWSALFSH